MQTTLILMEEIPEEAKETKAPKKRRKLTEGQERKVEGVAKVEEGNPDFVDLMRKAAAKIAAERGEVSTDDLRKYAAKRNLRPVSTHAWGVVFLGGGWRSIRRQRSTWPSNNARWIHVWVRTK